jgi:DNA (cytosine-5)-methyltransferase 1
LNELALFAGAGGGILGGQLLGWRTVCAVEWEPYPASVLCARQNQGLLPHFPIWDDVQTFDGKPWRGIVDVISGGFPCQDISCAGKGAGIEGQKSGMWKEFARIIGEVRPKYVFVENSPMLTSRGLGTVLGDLASMGFDAEWGVLSAADVGANHQRDRIWIVAYTNSIRGRWGNKYKQSKRNSSRKFTGISSETVSRQMAHSNSTHGERNEFTKRGIKRHALISESSWWSTEPDVGRVADGVAARVDRLKAIGNGQVPLCAATAFKLLRERLK